MTKHRYIVLVSVLGLAVTGWVFWSRPRHTELEAPLPAPADPAEPGRKPPRIVAPPAAADQAPVTAAGQVARPESSWNRWIESDNWPRASLEQVQPFLEANHRSAASLLGAFRATGDKSLLLEALEKHPSDPAVNFVALFKSATPEERRQRLEALKTAAPDNPLANYLSAQDWLKAGQAGRAVEELAAAAGKTRWQDYMVEQIQSAEEALRAAGFSEAEAKGAAVFGQPLPDLAKLKELGASLGDLAAQYRQAGDSAAAQTVLQSGMPVAQRLQEDGSFIKGFVGLAVESRLLQGLDPAAAYDGSGRTVQDRLDQIAQRRATMKEAARQEESLLREMSEADLARFFDRTKLFGETEALRWAATRQGKRSGG